MDGLRVTDQRGSIMTSFCSLPLLLWIKNVLEWVRDGREIILVGLTTRDKNRRAFAFSNGHV